MRQLLFAALGVACLAGPARAEPKLPMVFSNHAVLQQGQPLPVWGTADAGDEVVVTFRTAKATTKADAAGKWMVKLPAQVAGGPDELVVASGGATIRLTDILVGEVWICSGQSNMEWSLNSSADADKHIPAATNDKIRLFTVQRDAKPTPQTNVAGSWKTCTPETAKGFSGVAYFFGRDLQKARNVPIGLIHTSWGGTPCAAWTSKEALNAEPSLQYYHDTFDKLVKTFDPEKAKVDFEKAKAKHKEAVAKAREEGKKAPNAPRMAELPGHGSHSPSALYNAMIAPLVPYAINGAIWYQGESNGTRGFEYRTLYATMIKDWRKRWGQDFTFLGVQLAPFNSNDPDAPHWAELREAQVMSTKLPKVGLAVITDVGEPKDIHPKKKEPVGARLALLARKHAYGETLVADGPQYKGMSVEGNQVVLSFDSVGTGLEARGGELTGFTVCGVDGTFKPAKATIDGDKIRVWSDAVPKPTAVRYGWKNYPELNLFNKNGLPASPFRTDSFPLVSEQRKIAA